MNRPLLMAIIGAAALALVSAWGVLSQKAATSEYVPATALAGDAFDRWEQPAPIPQGVFFEDSIQSAVTSFTRTADSTVIWHAPMKPLSLPANFETLEWNGGWLFGRSVGEWQEGPGMMAAHWQPREGGKNQLIRMMDGTLRSTYASAESSGRFETVHLIANEHISGMLALPVPWQAWFESIRRNQKNWSRIEVGAFPLPHVPRKDSVSWLVNGAWMELELASGVLLSAFDGVDSLDALRLGGTWKDGIWYRSSHPLQSDWSGIPALTASDLGGNADFDFARATENGLQVGHFLADGRIIWNHLAGMESEHRPAKVDSPQAVDGGALTGGMIGQARNHRTGRVMDLVWDGEAILAMDRGEVVWKWGVEANTIPRVWEVDLYRNGKYQVAIGAGKRFDVVDVLGRQVSGFPKRWSDGFSAMAVVDYDRNRQYRFLLAAPNGQVFNFRKEGERTPGWKFKAKPGRHIIQLEHLRIGPNDVIFAAQDDGSIRLLSRTGEDRFDSPVRLPVGQKVAFRLGKDIASSTVLFVDDEGWVQERTLGGNEAVGMSRMTRGQSVRVEDRDGAALPVVVVVTLEGEEVWNERNERIGDRSIPQN